MTGSWCQKGSEIELDDKKDRTFLEITNKDHSLQKHDLECHSKRFDVLPL